MNTPETVQSFRQEFPRLEGKIYFNHAASSPMPTSVLHASIEGVTLGADACVSSALKQRWTEARAETRKMAGELIGAPAENIAFTASTSTALSLISLAIPWKNGDNVITSTVENPATVVAWQNLQHMGVDVRYVPANEDDLIDLDALPGLVDKRTRLVALSLVQYATGQRLDMQKVVEFCRSRDILVSVDAVQAAGAVPLDIVSMGVNFLSFGALKWLLGPRHIAVLYADDTALDTVRSPIVTESSVRDIREEEEQPTHGIPQLWIDEDARKFETVPYDNFAGVFGLRQALRNVGSVGETTIDERLRDITDRLVEGLSRLDGRVVSPRGEDEWSGIVAFAPTGFEARDLVTELQRHGVYVALRKGRIRMSPHYYNTHEEVDEFLATLKRAMGQF